MPKLMNNDSMEFTSIQSMQDFKFSGVRTENLTATEYTVVTIAIDETGSISGFKNDLKNMLITTVNACKRSPRVDNLLLRVIKFSSSLQDGVEELHGFIPVNDIDVNDYETFNPGGMTPLYDAAFSTIGGLCDYAKKLTDDDFLVNGIGFILTDGYDNQSKTTPKMISDLMTKSVRSEEIESLVTILIGINATVYQSELDSFKNDAGITQYIDVGDVTEGKLAKLADFVSQSISSQSNAIGTGGPSTQISASI